MSKLRLTLFTRTIYLGKQWVFIRVISDPMNPHRMCVAYLPSLWVKENQSSLILLIFKKEDVTSCTSVTAVLAQGLGLVQCLALSKSLLKWIERYDYFSNMLGWTCGIFFVTIFHEDKKSFNFIRLFLGFSNDCLFLNGFLSSCCLLSG